MSCRKRPVTHFVWQVLRAVKRSALPPTGEALRAVPHRLAEGGGFLNALVRGGLLERLSGSASDPLAATYALTDRGEDAAEFGCYAPRRISLNGVSHPV